MCYAGTLNFSGEYDMTRSVAKLRPVEYDEIEPVPGSNSGLGKVVLTSVLAGAATLATCYLMTKLATKKQIPRLPAPEAEVIELGRS